VKKGISKPDVSTSDIFNDDIYMLPVLDDDAVLFSIDDLGDVSNVEQRTTEDLRIRVEELETELKKAREVIAELRALSQRTLESDPTSVVPSDYTDSNRSVKRYQEGEDSYFSSYAYNGKTLLVGGEISANGARHP